MKRTLFVAPLLLTGCLRTLPSLETPSTEAPSLALEPAPLAPDKARVTIDAVGEPARVYVERARAKTVDHLRFEILVYEEGKSVRTHTETVTVETGATRVEPLCKTPCAVDLPPGLYSLHFEPHSISDRASIERDQAFVKFGPTPSVYRRAVGTQPSPKAVVAHAVVSLGWIGSGLGFAAAGGGLLASGEATTAASQRAGGAMIGFGAAIAVSGLIYTLVTRPEYQPGAGVQFPAAAAAQSGSTRAAR